MLQCSQVCSIRFVNAFGLRLRLLRDLDLDVPIQCALKVKTLIEILDASVGLFGFWARTSNGPYSASANAGGAFA
jgi:hypothetical protein